VAFDLSERMLDVVAKESARRGHANISTVRGMAESLPFPDGTFDLVVTRYSAHHWSDVPRAVTEMRRVLKPGGMAVAMDVFAPDSPLLDTWLQSLELLRDPSHVRDHSLKEWRRYFADAGIGVKTVDSFRLRQEFKPWIDRMAPPESHVAAIRSLQEGAAAEVVRHFAFEANGSFTIDTMVISGS
jgi:ubiquinone/menaquinone biosynthesis C-methylase UbiE